MLVFGAIVFVFSPQLVAFFRDDPDVISAGTPLLRFQCVTGFLQGIIIMTNMIVQNMGKTLLASFLAIARQGVFFIPLVLILPQFFGLTTSDDTVRRRCAHGGIHGYIYRKDPQEP